MSADRRGFSPTLARPMLSAGDDQVRDVERTVLHKADAQRLKTRTHSLSNDGPTTVGGGAAHFEALAVPGGFRRGEVAARRAQRARRSNNSRQRRERSDAARLLRARPLLGMWESFELLVSQVYGGGEQEVDDDSRVLPELTPFLRGARERGLRFDSVWDSPYGASPKDGGSAGVPPLFSLEDRLGGTASVDGGGVDGSSSSSSGGGGRNARAEGKPDQQRSFQTFLSVLKANTGIALLLYPRAFRNGGLGVTLVTTAVIGALTIAAQLRLLDVSDTVGAAVERYERDVEEKEEALVEAAAAAADAAIATMGDAASADNFSFGSSVDSRHGSRSGTECDSASNGGSGTHGIAGRTYTADGRRVLSYAQLASLILGPWAGPCVDVSLVLAQSGTCCGYMIYCAQNIAALMESVNPGLKGSIYLSPNFLIPAQCILLIPLCWIRKVQKLAYTNLLGVALIGGTVIYLIGFSCQHLAADGVGKGTDFFVAEPSSTVALMLGTSLFTFEGIGLVLPLYAASPSPTRFRAQLGETLSFYICVLCTMGALAYATFGAATDPFVTGSLPQSSPVTLTIEGLYCIALLSTFPLQAFPITRIIERWCFKKMNSGPVTLARKWLKNLARAVVVLCITAVSIFGGTSLDNFIALVGAVCCVPLMFM